MDLIHFYHEINRRLLETKGGMLWVFKRDLFFLSFCVCVCVYMQCSWRPEEEGPQIN